MVCLYICFVISKVIQKEELNIVEKNQGGLRVNVLVLTRLPVIDASSRQRVYQFQEILKTDYGINLSIDPFYPYEDFIEYRSGKLNVGRLAMLFLLRINKILKCGNYDLVWVLRGLAPIESPFLFNFIKRKKIPIIFEFDDAIYLGEKASRLRTKLTRSWDKIHKYVSKSDAIIVGNKILGTWAEKYNHRVFNIPTGVDMNDYPIKKKIDSDGVFTIGWIGSSSTAPNLELVLPAIEEFSKKRKVKFIVLGGLPMSFENENIEYKDIPWSLENQMEILQQFDVGIAPLYDTPFNKGKCAYKIIQYMATGLPVIASPVGIQKDIIKNFNNGYLASDPKEWVDAFFSLANSIDLRKKMGVSSRVAAEENYDLRILARQLSDTIKSVYRDKLLKEK